MIVLQRIFARFLRFYTRRAAIRVHQHLQFVDSTSLLNAGLSPTLLAKGPLFYPWRASETPASVQSEQVKPENSHLASKKFAAAIKQLSACSDSELQDMGISRADIRQVVMTGRADGLSQSIPPDVAA